MSVATRNEFVRPDGRTYRPRRTGLWTRAWENLGSFDDEERGCIVFGTLDPAAAEQLARESCNHWYGDPDIFDVAAPLPGWWRDGFGHAGRTWIKDEDRGAPGVMFTWAERATAPNPGDAS